MSQKELIHLSFGPFAAHLNAHLFNAQSAQFNYGGAQPDASSDVLIDHDVDWRAGLGHRGEDTYCPRLILFDTRRGCRGRRFMDGPYDDGVDGETQEWMEQGEGEDGEGETSRLAALEKHGLNAWSNPAIVQRTEPCHKERNPGWMDTPPGSRSPSPSPPPSDDEDEALGSSSTVTTTRDPLRSSQPKHPRSRLRPHRRIEPPTWSSYSLFDLHPRSLHPLQSSSVGGELRAMLDDDEPDTEDPRANNFTRLEGWERGVSVGKEEEKVKDVMDESVRWFAEDSDALQGFNFTTASTDGFAGLTSYYLSQVRDEFPKSTVLVWSGQWGSTRAEQLQGEAHDRARIRAMNAVLSIATFSENASLTVPLVMPEVPRRARKAKPPAVGTDSKDVWALAGALSMSGGNPPQQTWTTHLSAKSDLSSNLFHATAFLAPHIDTSTLGMRLKARPTSAVSLVSQLNWRRDTPLASLRGSGPTPLLAPLEGQRNVPMDPIDALLASRGYGPERTSGRRGDRPLDPRERIQKAARAVRGTLVDLSSLDGRQPRRATDEVRPFAESWTARDSAAAERANLEALDALSTLESPLRSAFFAPVPFKLSRAWPQHQLLKNLTTDGRPLPEGAKRPHRIEQLPIVSSLRTTPEMAPMLKWAKNFLSKDVLDGHLPLSAYGIGSGAATSSGAAASEENDGPVGGRDGLLEVRERLEELLSAYEEEGNAGEEELVGTDEEYEVEEDEEWDLDDD